MAIMAATTVATMAAPAAIMAAPQAPPLAMAAAAPAAPPPIASGVGIVTVSVAAMHPAERHTRQPVLQGTVIMPAVSAVPECTPIAEHKEAARSDAQEVVFVGAAAGHRAATHTRQPAGEDIPIGVAGPRQSVVIAVIKPVTCAHPVRITKTPRWFLHRGVSPSLS